MRKPRGRRRPARCAARPPQRRCPHTAGVMPAGAAAMPTRPFTGRPGCRGKNSPVRARPASRYIDAILARIQLASESEQRGASPCTPNRTASSGASGVNRPVAGSSPARGVRRAGCESDVPTGLQRAPRVDARGVLCSGLFPRRLRGPLRYPRLSDANESAGAPSSVILFELASARSRARTL